MQRRKNQRIIMKELNLWICPMCSVSVPRKRRAKCSNIFVQHIYSVNHLMKSTNGEQHIAYELRFCFETSRVNFQNGYFVVWLVFRVHFPFVKRCVHFINAKIEKKSRADKRSPNKKYEEKKNRNIQSEIFCLN